MFKKWGKKKMRYTVKCPGCGLEYSLGRKIYHSCESHEICHGIIFEKECVSRPWNCNPIDKYNETKLKHKDYLSTIEKLIEVVKS
jgi:hypothetical protein